MPLRSGIDDDRQIGGRQLGQRLGAVPGWRVKEQRIARLHIVNLVAMTVADPASKNIYIRSMPACWNEVYGSASSARVIKVRDRTSRTIRCSRVPRSRPARWSRLQVPLAAPIGAGVSILLMEKFYNEPVPGQGVHAVPPRRRQRALKPQLTRPCSPPYAAFTMRKIVRASRVGMTGGSLLRCSMDALP